MNPFTSNPEPHGETIRTGFAPAVPAGVVATIVVSLMTEKAAGIPPMRTSVAPVKFVPPIVTCVPPAVGPTLGVTELTTRLMKHAPLA